MFLAASICCCLILLLSSSFSFFFFNDTATTEIYTLSLHDALPICDLTAERQRVLPIRSPPVNQIGETRSPRKDRKSTRLNSSHDQISYAVFCLKKKKKTDRRFARDRKLLRPVCDTLACSFATDPLA